MTGDVAWITGVNGFIGHHMAIALRSEGWKVIGFGRGHMTQDTLLPLSGDGFDQAIVRYGKPARVFHLAGGATVGRSLQYPLEDFESNVTTTSSLLDAVRRSCPECPVILASSSAVYGGGHFSPISTDVPLQPFSPYGQHKRMAELLAQTYAESFGMTATILRLFSIYGPGLRKQLLFDICTQLTGSAGPVSLGGSGDEIRDWCHVNDAVRTMTSLVPPPAGTVAIFNIGSGQGGAVRDVAARLVNVWKSDRPLVFSGHSRPGDPLCLIAAPDSLPTGFSPQISMDEGFAEFVSWFRSDCGGRAAP